MCVNRQVSICIDDPLTPCLVVQVLSSASPASTSATPHENGREYVAQAPESLLADLRRWFCPHNARLGEMLRSNGLGGPAGELSGQMTWTQRDSPLSGCVGGVGMGLARQRRV